MSRRAVISSSFLGNGEIDEGMGVSTRTLSFFCSANRSLALASFALAFNSASFSARFSFSSPPSSSCMDEGTLAMILGNGSMIGRSIVEFDIPAASPSPFWSSSQSLQKSFTSIVFETIILVDWFSNVLVVVIPTSREGILLGFSATSWLWSNAPWSTAA